MIKNQNILVIIAFRGLGDLIYHLPLLRSLHATYKTKLNILSNKVNNSMHVYKNEKFVKKIVNFDTTRRKLLGQAKETIKLRKYLNSMNLDKVFLTSNSSRLVIPVMLSNAKEKVIFDKRYFPSINYNKLKNMNSSNKLFLFTKNLNLSKKVYNFNLTPPNNKNRKSKNVLLNVDSHHNQNDWNLSCYFNLIEGLLKKKFKIFINFKSIKISKGMFPDKLKNSKNIKFTNKKNVGQLINIINTCKYVIGNESGPICLGSSLKKIVHTIFLPIHTEPESRLINKNNKYYNVNKYSEKNIIKKILDSL